MRGLPTDCHCHDDHVSLSSRFSSGDLSSELDDEPNADPGLATVGRQDSSQPYQAVPDRPLQSQPGPMQPPAQPPIPGNPPQGPPQPIGGDLSLNLRPGSRTTSAPSSPAKTRESLLQRVQSLTGAARDQASCAICVQRCLLSLFALGYLFLLKWLNRNSITNKTNNKSFSNKLELDKIAL